MAVVTGVDTWARNTNCIVRADVGYDTTGIALWIYGTGNYFGATLVSDRHFIFATHTGIAPGHNIYYVNNDNTTFMYSVESVQSIGPSLSTDFGYTDISVGYFTTPVDSSLAYYKVFPPSFENYLQNITVNPEDLPCRPWVSPVLPMFYMNQQKKFLCGDLNKLTRQEVDCSLRNLINFQFSYNTARFNNSEQLIVGDSGNAVFVPVNDGVTSELIFMGGLYASSGELRVAGNQIGTCSAIYKYIPEIDVAMSDLAGVSSGLTVYNMSAFTNY